MLVFPEDRLHPIVLRDQLPYRWVRRGAGGALADTAARGEFVATIQGQTIVVPPQVTKPMLGHFAKLPVLSTRA